MADSGKVPVRRGRTTRGSFGQGVMIIFWGFFFRVKFSIWVYLKLGVCFELDCAAWSKTIYNEI